MVLGNETRDTLTSQHGAQVSSNQNALVITKHGTDSRLLVWNTAVTDFNSRPFQSDDQAAAYCCLPIREQQRGEARERENMKHCQSRISYSYYHNVICLLLNAQSAFVCFGITRSLCWKEVQVSRAQAKQPA
ncbi:hypothetical protein DPX16_12847 [Anabarilius grahami]|uniref:Uncharacterized protein n=1 Tax=Anabarilius grahami TaxID=495550 RepID=A0A3N0XDY1_ANAGA|nr:hypothetical protein DPX16_12847 [Anabarilius grahami]